MGLTSKSMGINALTNEFIYKDNESDIVIALGGNPNVGKSTIFNELTGMNQHTGNWTGKTVTSLSVIEKYLQRVNKHWSETNKAYKAKKGKLKYE